MSDVDDQSPRVSEGVRLGRIGLRARERVLSVVALLLQSPLFGLPHIFAVAFCIWIAWTVSPPILGFWEGSIFFHTLSPEEIWLSTAIHPRSCIGCYEYAAMDLGRYLTQLFGLSLRTLRVVPILAGLLSLWLSYLIFRRFSRPVVALGAVLLLASNPVFGMFQHQMLVSIVTFAALLCCVESFFCVDRERPSSRALWAFSAACVFAALHYQIGRFCMLAIVFFWSTRGIRVWPRVDLSEWEVRHPDGRRKYIDFGKRVLLILAILNPVNVFWLVSPRFLSPTWGEHASSFAEAVHSISINAPLILKSFLGGGDFFGPHSTDIINSVPFPSLSIPLFAIGAVGCLTIVRQVLFDRRIVLVVFLLCLTAGPISLSSIFPSVFTTLSPFRLFYTVIPAFILIAVGLERLTSIGESLIDRLPGKQVRHLAVWLIVVAICAGVGFQTHAVLSEQERFSGFIEEMPCGEKGLVSGEYGCNSESETTTADPGLPVMPLDWALQKYQTDQIPVYRYSNLIRQFIRDNQGGNEALIVEVPISELAASANSHFSRFNFKKWMIALYLADQDVDVRIAVPYPGKNALSATQRFAGFLITRLATTNNYRGKFISRLTNYPLPFDGDTGSYMVEEADPFWTKIHRLVSERGWHRVLNALIWMDLVRETPADLNDRFHFTIRRFGGDESPVYLTTTQSESEFVLRELHGSPHRLVRFSHRTDSL